MGILLKRLLSFLFCFVFLFCTASKVTSFFLTGKKKKKHMFSKFRTHANAYLLAFPWEYKCNSVEH